MKFEETEVWGFEHALRGMRNPKESWKKSDSGCKLYCSEDDTYVENPCSYDNCNGCRTTEYMIGPNDMELAQSLIKAGSEHRKFMRQIFVSVDITAPLYWWKEFDTYKVGTVANSTSTMHKLVSTPITADCFEMDDFDVDNPPRVPDYMRGQFHVTIWKVLIEVLESLRQKYNETKDKRYWKELIRLLPESLLQKRTVTMDYENLLAMCSKGQRRFHKLTEWSDSFIKWARSLPYVQELIFIDEVKQ